MRGIRIQGQSGQDDYRGASKMARLGEPSYFKIIGGAMAKRRGAKKKEKMRMCGAAKSVAKKLADPPPTRKGDVTKGDGFPHNA